MFYKSCRACLICVLILTNIAGSSQKSFYGSNPVNWHSLPGHAHPKVPVSYSACPIVILKDDISFHFYSSDNRRIKRHVTYKINTAEGLEKIRNYRLPESFDEGHDKHYYKQGRKARTKIPYIYSYKVKQFAARKYEEGQPYGIPLQYHLENAKWIRPNGEIISDDILTMDFTGLQTGDIVEIYYESDFESSYGTNVFYFNSEYPKMDCEYTFIYTVDLIFSKVAFILPVNVPDSCVRRSVEKRRDDQLNTDIIRIHALSPVNYPEHCGGSRFLPHIFADFSFYYKVMPAAKNGGQKGHPAVKFRPENFEWVVDGDTVDDNSSTTNIQWEDIREFLSRLPKTGTDSMNVAFTAALSVELNNSRYIGANQLVYNESKLRNVTRARHLLHGRLVEITERPVGNMMLRLYKDIFNVKKVFYYSVNIQDKRFGDHSDRFRAHYQYETRLFVFPLGNSFVYLLPRYNGLKYHPDELPFYYEGALAMLIPVNYPDGMKNKSSNLFKFARTPISTYKENSRSENAIVKVSLDSLQLRMATRESLSGQFSTILRHLYLDELVDSTISSAYYKKCTDKPGVQSVDIKQAESQVTFPFRHIFSCNSRVKLAGDKQLSMKDWFAFPYASNNFSATPTHDFYFDFTLSDSYNFLLNFDRPVEIKNLADFKTAINNAWFDLGSDIVKDTETSYVVRVKLVIKQAVLPAAEGARLQELVKGLQKLNSFQLDFN